MEFLVSVILAILHKTHIAKTENGRHAKRSWKKRASKISFSKTVLVIAVLFLFIPLFVIIFYSFNESKGTTFTRPSLVWYEELLFSSGRLWLSLMYSAIVAVVSALIATILGSLAAIGISWYKFFGKNYIQSISFLPMVLPEVINDEKMVLVARQIAQQIENEMDYLKELVESEAHMIFEFARAGGFDNAANI